MNWVNLIFYIGCSVTGLCYLLWKTKIVKKIPKFFGEVIVWFGELFWVILIIFLLRSFAVEPFRIPSPSMVPTLEAGDFILVNKYTYGLRLPGFNTKITDGNKPKRGDVVVFRYPPEPSQDYIKRLIGLPGDIIEYRSEVFENNGKAMVRKILLINNQEVQKTIIEDHEEINNDKIKLYQEKIDGHQHNIREHSDQLVLSVNPSSIMLGMQCEYDLPVAFSCKIPEGHYFMLGDNRDESADSRYWGFVPEANLVGKAFVIWMNFGKLTRIGSIN